MRWSIHLQKCWTGVKFDYFIMIFMDLNISGFFISKIHKQACEFLQPTRANIHQYQFNSPIILQKIHAAGMCFFVLLIKSHPYLFNAF